MADLDIRREYRGTGGGGGGRGFNKRKRFREEDDDDHQSYRNQRQRQDAPPGTRLRRLLLEVGEDAPRQPHEAAYTTAKLVTDNYEDDYVKETLRTIVLKLVIEQPFKIPFVAAVVLCANNDQPRVAQDIIARSASLCQEYLDAGLWREFKLVLRFLACLSTLYEQDGVMSVFDELFSRAVDLQTASQDDCVGLELVKIILLTIPYLLAANEDAALQAKAAEMLEKTDIVASTPHPLESLVDPYPSATEEGERPMACSSIISLLQRQLQAEANRGWPLKCIPRVYDPSYKPPVANGDANGEANGDIELKDVSKHTFPTFTVPSPINHGRNALFPELYFSLYADQEIESVPSTTSIASSILRDAILDTINILDFNRNVTARLLNEIDCFWAAGTFAKRGTTFDKLRELKGDGHSTWKPEDVVIDAVFNQIFQLPTPEHRLVYYHSLITESCKISPGAIAPSLGRAIRFLFRNIDQMDMELGFRFMDWFSHHLSNFEFRWKWAEWIPDLALSDLEAKKAFIIGTLDKEIQLSFAKRVRDTLPTDYHPLIPPSKEVEVPKFKYADDTIPYAKEGRELLSMLKKKAPDGEVQAILDSVHEQATQHGVADPLVASTDVYVTAICSIGSKSLSHVLSTIDRCKDRLLKIGPSSEPARRQIITSVIDFWADHPGTAVNIIDKLLNYTIVTPMSVVGWSLQDDIAGGSALARLQTYDLVSVTMYKVTNRVRQVLRERNNVSLPFEQRRQFDEALPRERDTMRQLFAAIREAVEGVASGLQDQMVERFDGESVEQDSIRVWAGRWIRVWSRKAAVEEAIVGEGVVEELVEPPAPAPVDQGAGEALDDLDQIA